MGNAHKREAEDPAAQKSNAQINKDLKNDAKRIQSQLRVLLLGAGESGKSTIFKQMKLMHGDGFPKDEQLSFKPVVYENVLRNIKALVVACDRLGKKISPSNQEFAENVRQMDTEMFMNSTKIWHEKLAQQIGTLWKDEGIQQTFIERNKFQMDDCIDYFFNNLKRIGAPEYLPSVEDILRCRMKTTGITEMDFKFYNSFVRMIDVGGQRNERRKWIHCFEGVTAIIFVTSLSEYNQRCEEDDSTNRMKESLNLFGDIAGSKYFLSTPIILFLNKVDIFKEKIKTANLNVLFEDYTGGCNYENAIDFVKKQFELLADTKGKERTPELLFIHVTCATDTDQVKKVFGEVKKIVLKDAVSSTGLL